MERRDIVATAKAMSRELSKSELDHLSRLFTEKIDSYLDAGAGECLLARPTVARIVAQTISHFDELRYRLFAWCVTPNHVHAVFQPAHYHSLAEIVHSWKSFSAKGINRAMERRGAFWQREYYDHLIRDERDLRRTVKYVLENPVKANLKQWAWVRAKPL